MSTLTISQGASLRRVLDRIKHAHTQLGNASDMESRGFGDQSHKRADARAAIAEASQLLDEFIEENK